MTRKPAKRTAKPKTAEKPKPKTAAELHEAARVLRRQGGTEADVREVVEQARAAERAESAA